jgi:CHRD domain-containing protein
MRRVVLVAAAAIIMMGLTAPAQAETIRFTALLSGGNETPVILTGAFATATVELDTTSQTVSWVIDVFNLPSGINNAHFHVAGVGIAGPTVVNIPFTANQSNDFRLTGSATSANLNVRAEQGIRSWDDFMQSLVGEQTYLNIHTTVNGGGEIRGQVLRVR